ncbi:ACT domain-containing protein [Longimicrobium sp.]|uniref:ACT domain-containing protein n=1 Tax=Longimicrobium sp. TaxID=2029185 RepID=UPI002D0786DB|nr:ACT domain-containing protein [Longimicrobium sp.]HSU16482.1 ACT domain-containing protein [Longimicrobium sp.]
MRRRKKRDAPPPLTLTLLDDTFAVSRLPADAVVPVWAWTGEVACVTRTRDELSIVCRADLVPAEVLTETGWRCLRVKGPLSFALTGVFARIAQPLANAGISLFAVMTYDTDYVMVKQAQLAEAVHALMAAGHTVEARLDRPAMLGRPA